MTEWIKCSDTKYLNSDLLRNVDEIRLNCYAKNNNPEAIECELIYVVEAVKGEESFVVKYFDEQID